MTIDDDDSGWGDHLLSATPAVDSGIAPECLTSKVVPVRSSHIERYEHDIPHRNCDGIIAPSVTGCSYTPERREQTRRGCVLNVATHGSANTVRCDGSSQKILKESYISASSYSDLQNPHPSDEASSICMKQVEHGERTSTVRVTPRPSTREERIFAILVETFKCPSDSAKLMAVEFLSSCLQRQLDPIAVLTDLSLKWRMARADTNAFPLEKLGAWLGSCLVGYKPSVEAHRQSWSAVREKIVTAVRTKSVVMAADLRDYWDHCLATGKSHDAIFLQAIAELEEAGLVARHGHALAIHAEELKIQPRKREEVTKEQGMEMVKAASIKAWGPDVWEQRLNELLCNLPWWRNMGGLALRGLADWVETL